jgi:hypothetical protein
MLDFYGGKKVLDSLFLVVKIRGDMNIIGLEVIIVESLIPSANTGLFLKRDFACCKINYGLIMGEEEIVVKKVCGKLLLRLGILHQNAI